MEESPECERTQQYIAIGDSPPKVTNLVTLRLRIVSEKALREFARRHSDSTESLEGWKRVVRNSAWKSFVDVRATFSSADSVGEKTVFDIAFNRYRLIAYIHFRRQIVFVKAILTHRQYDKGDWK
jgi:mRNA interferase HigB